MIAIRCDGLGKQYRIGRRERYRTFRDTLSDIMYAPFRRNRSALQPSDLPTSQYADENNTIWALKDVSFEIGQGEVIGLIGSNGSGKSTLLKILSRITEPTEGTAEIRGRVSSLLEVGTGFHPELTGRENIYLNGAILGMKRIELDRNFDEIVAFAEIERFLDTPVKHYSSGMYVRLAFAVAAHLEPEILLVDEVLAVGDAAFQRKCLGKMANVASVGRTVLFISHNMQAISYLCSSTILLGDGRVVSQGQTAQVIGQYLSWGTNKSAEAVWSFEGAPGTSIAKLRSVRALNEVNEPCFNMGMNNPITLRVEFWILRQARVEVSLHLYNREGVRLFATGNFHDPSWRGIEHEPGLYAASCTIPKHYLNEGVHSVEVYLHHGNPHQVDVKVPEVVSFDVRDPGDTRGDWTGQWAGVIRPILAWTGERLGAVP